MSTLKYIFIVGAFFCFLNSSFGQTKGGKRQSPNKMEQFEGVVVQKP